MNISLDPTPTYFSTLSKVASSCLLAVPIIGQFAATWINQRDYHVYGDLENNLAKRRWERLFPSSPTDDPLQNIKRVRQTLHERLVRGDRDPKLLEQAYILRSQSPGIEHLCDAVPLSEECHLADLYTWLTKLHASSPLINPDLRPKDTLLEEIDRIADLAYLTLSHPLVSFGAVQSTGLINNPLDFDPYSYHNYDLAAGDYVINGRAIRFIYGPTPTGSHLFYGHLQHLHDGKNGHMIYHSLLNPKARGEKEKRDLIEKTLSNCKRCTFIATPLDGPSWIECDIEEPVRFIQHYIEESQRDSERFILAKSHLFASAANHLVPHLTSLPLPQDALRRNRLIQLLTQALYTSALLIHKAKEQVEGPLHFQQACLNDCDRGPLLNQTLQLLFQTFSLDSEEPALKPEQARLILGPLFTRPALQGRAGLKETFQTFADLLYLIQEAPADFVELVQSFFHAHKVTSAQFVPLES